MGTSKSYGGPTDTSSLLPAWAQNPEGPAPGTVSPDDAASGPDGGATAPDAAAPDPDDNTPAPGATVASDKPWMSAKIRLGRAAQSGSRDDVRSAGSAYVHARGGGRAASGAARSGRRATASLAGFVSGIADRDVRTALELVGLADFVGRDEAQVFAAIVNALAPNGASLEEAAARHAVADVLEELYTRFAVEAGGLDRLNEMTAEDVRTAIELSIARYIYHRWIGELCLRVEQKAVSSVQAERLEREMKQYVRDVVELDLGGIDLLRFEWNGAAGTRLLESLYEQAYAILGSGETT